MMFLAEVGPVPGPINWNTIVVAAIGVLGTGVSGIIAIFMAKMSQSAVEIKRSVAEGAVSMEKAHVAINSERSMMMAELKVSRNEILELSKQLATVIESHRAVPGRLTEEQLVESIRELHREAEGKSGKS